MEDEHLLTHLQSRRRPPDLRFDAIHRSRHNRRRHHSGTPICHARPPRSPWRPSHFSRRQRATARANYRRSRPGGRALPERCFGSRPFGESAYGAQSQSGPVARPHTCSYDACWRTRRADPGNECTGKCEGRAGAEAVEKMEMTRL